jgi:hydrogenase nickel incorporation protein HypA/HybF
MPSRWLEPNMHEMSLMESVREIVEQTARGQGARRVATVRLEIGALATVDPDALRFCFDVVMHDSVAADARLEIESVPGSGWCWDCSEPVAIAEGGMPCPRCGGFRLEVTGGTQMRVKDIDLGPEEEISTCA